VFDSIDLFFFERVCDQIRATDISLDKFVVGEFVYFGEVGEAGAVIDLVVDNHFVLGVFFA